jgi:threonine aldolase
LFNAVVASGIEVTRWTQHFDTVSVCFSKGLGAPVGSALAGSREWIAEAVRHRKVLGGGMRQAGIIAAAALYALEHHVDRLADDHANAQRLAAGIRRIERLRLIPEKVETNLVFFQVDPSWGTAGELSSALETRGVLMNAFSRTMLRAATHLDVDAIAVDRALGVLQDVMRGR